VSLYNIISRASDDLRARYRYLDLRNSALSQNLKKRSDPYYSNRLV
jgi:aspartyl-tRNA synthetase